MQEFGLYRYWADFAERKATWTDRALQAALSVEELELLERWPVPALASVLDVRVIEHAEPLQADELARVRVTVERDGVQQAERVFVLRVGAAECPSP